MGVTVKPVDFLEVLERDNYVCGFCHKSILLNAPSRDRLSPSLDHETWLMDGGSHIMSNVRAAHLHCNTEPGWARVQAAKRTGGGGSYEYAMLKRRKAQAARMRRQTRERREGAPIAGCLVGFVVWMFTAGILSAVFGSTSGWPTALAVVVATVVGFTVYGRLSA